MTTYRNPPLWSAAPTDGQVPVYSAALDELVPTAIASIGSPLTVPQTGTALPAVTSTQNATAAAATQTGSYVQADAQTVATLANALKTSYNAAQVDIAALSAAVETLMDALEAAGVITVT
jgi:hypothetical protein